MATPLERTEILELAGRAAEPAVTIMTPIAQPVAAHPETEPQLRALVDRALDVVRAGWGTDAAAGVAAQLEAADLSIGVREDAHGLAVLVTADECHVEHLPFTVSEQVVVDQTFATRQLLEGLARHPRLRVLVLAGHHARLLEGRLGRLAEVEAHGFPMDVEPPHEWDTPHGDLPIHEDAEREEHRAVYRRVDEALGVIDAAEHLPVVVTGAERELSLFDEVTAHGPAVIGRVHGSFSHASPAELAVAVGPAVEAHRAIERRDLVHRLREAHGHAKAVFDLPEVQRAASEGRGHLLVVEEGFTFPRHWVDGLTHGAGEDRQLEVDDLVDDLVEAVLLAGGEVEFVEPGALDDEGHIGLLLRY